MNNNIDFTVLIIVLMVLFTAFCVFYLIPAIFNLFLRRWKKKNGSINSTGGMSYDTDKGKIR